MDESGKDEVKKVAKDEEAEKKMLNNTKDNKGKKTVRRVYWVFNSCRGY